MFVMKALSKRTHLQSEHGDGNTSNESQSTRDRAAGGSAGRGRGDLAGGNSRRVDDGDAGGGNNRLDGDEGAVLVNGSAGGDDNGSAVGRNRAGGDEDGGLAARDDGGLAGGAAGQGDSDGTGRGGDGGGSALGGGSAGGRGLGSGGLDVEGVGVLEDRGVALVLEDQAVDSGLAEVSANGPGVLVGGVGDTGGDVEERDLGVLGSTTDQVDGDGAIGVLGGGSPGDLEGRASLNYGVGLGGVDRVEVGGLGEGRGGHGQDSRDGETHLGGVLFLGWCGRGLEEETRERWIMY